METDRKLALEKGDKTFIGKPCAKDEEHGDERYTSSGSCVICAGERVIAARKEKPKKALMSKGEVQSLLLRGGPEDRAQAEAAGLPWYKPPQGALGCPDHRLIYLSGFCGQCGQATPEPEDVKAELDLVAKLLS